MIAIIGLLIGVVIGIIWHPVVPSGLEPYLPIAIVAALDAVFGGFRAIMEKRFDDRIFVVSFLSNVLIASMRIFANAAAIRRILFRA
jgi:small basic protein